MNQGFIKSETIKNLMRKNHIIRKKKYILDINKILLFIISPVILFFLYYIYQLWNNYLPFKKIRDDEKQRMINGSKIKN